MLCASLHRHNPLLEDSLQIRRLVKDRPYAHHLPVTNNSAGNPAACNLGMHHVTPRPRDRPILHSKVRSMRSNPLASSVELLQDNNRNVITKSSLVSLA